MAFIHGLLLTFYLQALTQTSNPSLIDPPQTPTYSSERRLPPAAFPTTDELSESSEDTFKLPQRTLPIDALPLEFPNSDSNYTFVDNSTIRENLAQRAKQVDTEVSDLLQPGIELQPKEVVGDEEKDVIKEQELLNRTSTAKDDPNQEAEMLEPLGYKDNEDLRFAEVDPADDHLAHGHYQRLGVPLVHGQMAVIIAFVFVAITVVAYITLISWRRFLENRYGNRELLVNEDFTYDPNDVRNFEL